MEERLQARGSFQKVCASCAIAAINEMAAESIWEMTDAEIEAELRADGVDVEAFAERTRKILLDAMAKRDAERKPDACDRCHRPLVQCNCTYFGAA